MKKLKLRFVKWLLKDHNNIMQISNNQISGSLQLNVSGNVNIDKDTLGKGESITISKYNES